MTFTNTIKVDVGHPWKTAQVYVKQGDKDSRKIRAELMNGAASWTIPVGTVATFRAKKPDETVVTQDATISSPNIVEVVLDEQVGAVFGVVRGEIRLVNGGEILNTFLIAINVEAAAVTDGDIVSRDVLDEYQALVEQMLAVAGSPLVANAAADMTDKTRVYVYTGSEDGYVTGDWYYWDGAAWTAGGAYNSQGIGDAFIEQTADYIRQSTVATESDKTPYLYRATPNPSAILADEEIVGATVAWNQIANGNFASTTGWRGIAGVSLAVSDNVMTATITGADTSNALATDPISTIPIGHVLMGITDVKPSGQTKVRFMGIGPSGGACPVVYEKTVSSGVWTNYASIVKIGSTSTAGRLYFYFNAASELPASATVQFKNTMLIDLTAMFGSTIADYLYTLESGTAGAGVAKLKEWGFLSKSYFPYNAGELMSVKTEGKRVTGKNLYFYDADNADTAPNTSNQTRGIYHTWCGGGTYSLSAYKIGDEATSIYINVGYLQNGIANLISDILTPSEIKQRTVVVPQGAELIIMSGQTTAAGLLSNLPKYDIQIEYGSNVTSYAPFKQHTYPTTDTALNGIYKLDASNNLYADGDVYEADGTVTRRFDSVDLGTLSWNRTTSYSNPVLYATIPTRKTGNQVDAICAKYVMSGMFSSASAFSVSDDKTFGFGTSNTQVFVRDDSFTDAATFTTAMSGIYLVYELATPTTETATPFTATQIVGKGGTEEWIDSRSVPVPVGHETVYGIGVPDVPANASNATLKATVSGGKTTLSWS